jgi:predicted kinase
VERKRLFGLAPEQRSEPADEKNLYGSAMSKRTFERLEQLARTALAAGFAVIVDATFLYRANRDRFRLLAQSLQQPFVIIECRAPNEVLRQRLAKREKQGRDASEAGVRVMENQLAVDQPPAGDELPFTMAADSGEDAPVLWQRLRAQCAGQQP